MASCVKPLGARICPLVPPNFGTPTAVFKTAAQVAQPQPRTREPFTADGQTSSATSSLSFDDPETAFASKSSSSLLRSLCTLKACRIKPLVHNANSLLRLSRACMGQKMTDKIVEATFFNHFCAGTNVETIKPTLSYLKQRGLLPILNYAVEDDVKHAEDKGTSAGLADIEAKPNANACIFMQSIADCDNTTPSRGFVSAKITGLTQPALLERMSKVLTENGNTLDRGHHSSDLGRLMATHLSPAESRAAQNLWQRLDQLASAVHDKGNMRMMIDAEQTYMQPAIDALTIALQQKYNRTAPVIMNTYQCYLKCSAARIEADMKRASNEGWIWGAKTVRGAYMHQERALAAEQGYDSPIHDTIQDTHQNYNRCVDDVLGMVAKGKAELLVASHNQASVEKAIQAMHRNGLRQNNPDSGVYFGQLLGMADNLSFPLGANGYNIYKICAYGSVSETIAFLLRRALENSDALGGVSKEISMISAELLRRSNPLQRRQSQPAQEPAFQHA